MAAGDGISDAERRELERLKDMSPEDAEREFRDLAPDLSKDLDPSKDFMSMIPEVPSVLSEEPGKKAEESEGPSDPPKPPSGEQGSPDVAPPQPGEIDLGGGRRVDFVPDSPSSAAAGSESEMLSEILRQVTELNQNVEAVLSGGT